jgi:hypothetical protein
MHLAGQLLVKLGTFCFPGNHIIAHLFNNFTGVTYHQTARRYDFALFNECKGAYNAFFAKNHPVHDDCIHTHKTVPANFGAVDNGAMPNVRAGTQVHRYPGKHVNGTIFLHIAAIFQHNTTPIAAQSCTGAYVTILANYYIAGNGRLRVYKRGRVYHRYKIPEFVKHDRLNASA